MSNCVNNFLIIIIIVTGLIAAILWFVASISNGQYTRYDKQAGIPMSGLAEMLNRLIDEIEVAGRYNKYAALFTGISVAVSGIYALLTGWK